MAVYSILVLPGDHAGPEVVEESIKVLKCIEAKSDVRFNLNHQLCGGCSINKHGNPVTDEVVASAKQSDAVLFGSVGGPEWYISHHAVAPSRHESTHG